MPAPCPRPVATIHGRRARRPYDRQDVRLADGVHLTRAGGDRLAAEVLDVVEARAGLRSAAATRPAQG